MDRCSNCDPVVRVDLRLLKDEWSGLRACWRLRLSGCFGRLCSFRGFAPVCHDAHDVCFGCELPVNASLPAHTLTARAEAHRYNFDSKSVAGNDLTTKPRVVNAAEEDQLRRAVFHECERVDCSDLRHRF